MSGPVMSLLPPHTESVVRLVARSTLPSSCISEVVEWFEHRAQGVDNVSDGVGASNAARGRAGRDALDLAVLTVKGALPLDFRGALKVLRKRLDAGVACGAISSTVTSTDPNVCRPPDSALRASMRRITNGEVSQPVLDAHKEATQKWLSSVQSSA